MINDCSSYLSFHRYVLIVGVLLIISLSLPPPAQEKVTSILEALAQSRTVMYIGAHPDDENSIAGFLARSVGAGKKVYLVCFTRGENEPMDVGVPKGRPMAEARMQWLRDSAAILGAEPIQLPYTDGPSSVEE
ncbi:MAG: PIG-L family deacetylase, partial [Acidobacteria bacterium]